jgi:hypothetical protein
VVVVEEKVVGEEEDYLAPLSLHVGHVEHEVWEPKEP